MGLGPFRLPGQGARRRCRSARTARTRPSVVVAVRAAYRSQVRVTPDRGIDGGDGGEDETTSTVDSPAMATKRSPLPVNRKRGTGAGLVMLQGGGPTSSKTGIALSP